VSSSEQASVVLELTGLRLLGHHGLTETERATAQPFELDLVVGLEDRAAEADGSDGSDDTLEATVDYEAVLERAAAVVEGPSCALLETLARRIATAVLELEGVASVEVRVAKLRPPVPYQLERAAVRLVARRASRDASLADAGRLGEVGAAPGGRGAR
jgi:dihydroneopterin aldolase